METYEKASETEIKIISTTETIIPLIDLKKQQINLNTRIANLQNQYAITLSNLQAELDTVTKKIAGAEKLGILLDANSAKEISNNIIK